MDDLISRQAMLDGIDKLIKIHFDRTVVLYKARKVAEESPSVQPDIIRCKDCKHWNPQLKTANGNGLGSCDFHNVALVTSEGFCYWAERRTDAETKV